MSMINDALRRASSASRASAGAPPLPPTPAPVAPPPPPTPLQAAAASAFPTPPPLATPGDTALPPTLEPEPKPARKSSAVQIILGLLLVLAVGVAAAVNFWANKSRTATVKVSANEGRKPILPNAAAVRETNTTNAASSVAMKAPTNPAARAIPTAITTAAPVAVAALPPPKFPPLRLQSIFYRPSNPSVMINGKTLFLDDQIQGVTVADIQPASVILVLSGQTNVLTLR